MGIMVKSSTRVLCFAGDVAEPGTTCLDRMRRAGTEVVAMIQSGGEPVDRGPVPMYDTAAQAVRQTGANAALVDCPPAAAADAMMEAVDAALPLIVCRTAGVPARDMVKVISYLQGSSDLAGPRHNEGKIWLLGPGSSGVVSPGAGMVGSFDIETFRPGRVAIVSRSNALAQTVAAALTARRIGQSTCLVTGSALITPTRLVDALGMLEADPDTGLIVMLGGVGGNSEFEAASFISEAVTKPVIACLPGRTAPPGINLGAQGDFASAVPDEIEQKTTALRDAGAFVVDDIDQIAPAVAERL